MTSQLDRGPENAMGAKLLRRLKTDSRQTYKEIAARTGDMKWEHVRKLMTNRADITLIDIIKIATACDVKPEDALAELQKIVAE